jgi:sugar-phosphatase
MDGLLVDSEPLWAIASNEVFEEYGFRLSPEQHITTTGLRTREFVHWWFSYFKIPESREPEAEEKVLRRVLDLVSTNCKIMNGVPHVFELFHSIRFKIGIASSSPQEMIEVVMDLCDIRKYVKATASAQLLPYGKPHPQVYLNCAESLGSLPTSCIAFEDSFYGMIAAKAARMKCVVVPEHKRYKEEKWGAADLKMSSLQNFNALHLQLLQ